MAHKLRFDGVDDYVDFASGVSFNTETANIIANVEFVSFTGSIQSLVGNNNNNDISAASFDFGVDGTGKPYLKCGDSSRFTLGASPLTTNIKYKLEAVFTGMSAGASAAQGLAELYVDDVLIGSFVPHSRAFRDSGLGITFLGKRANQHFSDVHLYNLSFVTSAVNYYYNADSASSAGAGTTLYDDISGNNGTLTEFPVDESQWVYYPADVVTLTVKPSGGDYATLTDAWAAIPSDLVALNQQYDILCDTFTGGLVENFTTTAITCDIERYVQVKAAPGHEYDPVSETGFFVTTHTSYGAAWKNLNTNYVKLAHIGLKNTQINGARAIQSTSVTGSVYHYVSTAAGGTGFEIKGTNDMDLQYCLAEARLGIDVGSYCNGTIDHCTIIDAGLSAWRRDNGGLGKVLITNCLEIGSAKWDFQDEVYHNPSNDYNAASQSTAIIGANSLINRTTADLADYANGDYRTKSTSALANAGIAGTFIGYALEAGNTTLIASFSSVAVSSSSILAAVRYSAQFSSVAVSSGTKSGYVRYQGSFASAAVSSSQLVGSVRYSGSFASVNASSSSATAFARYLASFASAAVSSSAANALVRLDATFSSQNASSSSFSASSIPVATFESVVVSSSGFGATVRLNSSFDSLAVSSSRIFGEVRLQGEFVSLSVSSSSFKAVVQGQVNPTVPVKGAVDLKRANALVNLVKYKAGVNLVEVISRVNLLQTKATVRILSSQFNG